MPCPDIYTCDYACLRRGICDHERLAPPMKALVKAQNRAIPADAGCFEVTPKQRPTHQLKSWVGLFEPLAQGLKKHDFRVMDRDFQVGDYCLLREYEPTTKEYTGREALVQITYITSAKHSPCAFSPFPLHEGMAVLSVRLVNVV